MATLTLRGTELITVDSLAGVERSACGACCEVGGAEGYNIS